MASFKVGTYGVQLIAIDAQFDLSNNTDLEIEFTKPDQTTLTVNKSGGVSAPSSNLTIDVDGVSTEFLANEYWLYSWVSGDLDQAGTWSASGIYIEGANKRACGNSVTFQVLNC